MLVGGMTEDVVFLSFTLCELSKSDGTLRTSMIAAQASGTVALPLQVVGDVVERAVLGTQAAADAVVADVEVLIGDEGSVEQRTEHVALGVRHCTAVHIGSVLMVEYVLSDGWYAGYGLLQLSFGYLGTIDIEAWQADVGVRHLHRPCSMEGEAALALESLGKDVVGEAHIVAASHDCPYVLRLASPERMDELVHNAWRSPCIHGKHQTERLAPVRWGRRAVGCSHVR